MNEQTNAASSDAEAAGGQLPIEDHGIIGDLRSVALVGVDGNVAWFCYPYFDSPSVFASLLDREKGGHFRIAPSSAENSTRKQIYWPDTNVLVSRFLSNDGVAEVTDFMPVVTRPDVPGMRRLVRRASVLRGKVTLRLECAPAFDYARANVESTVSDGGATFRGGGLTLVLTSPVPLRPAPSGVAAEFTLSEGESVTFVLREPRDGEGNPASDGGGEVDEMLHATIRYWRDWVGRCTYTGRWRETVYRSALALKLLTFAPTGAIVAAPTCSLPERVGGTRNWDYRYTWIRDSAFVIYAFMRIGFTDEAAAFMTFLEARCREMGDGGTLQIMYGIDGRHDVHEETLAHLSGYHDSRPVRVGNEAYRQLQLDIYGELMDSVYLYNKYGEPISYDLWRYLRRLVDWVCDHWRDHDAGLWEVRGEQRDFVYSKLMCWVAVDRAIRLAEKRSLPAPREAWLVCRDAIYEDILAHGWNGNVDAFTQAYGSDALDASNLMMPLVFFLSPTDPRMLRTLDAINRTPAAGGLVSDGLVYRYNVEKTLDGVGGGEGTFNLCTFWLVEALSRAGRRDPERLETAVRVFEQMLGYGSHLGLYAEQIGARGEHLGNFPQALTHLSLISAAFNLDRTLNRR